MSALCSSSFFESCSHPRYLHSFPTRRSSDLVQVKGRDVFGMMKILPGVMDSHASRDYAQWNSGRYLSINGGDSLRSEEHTSELQSQSNLVRRPLLEKKTH